MFSQMKLLNSLAFLAFTFFSSLIHAAPSDFITRAKFTEWVMIAADIDISLEPAQNPFDDVEPSHPQYHFIHSARALGVVDGYENTNSFGPEDTILKKEAAKMLLNAFEKNYYPACRVAPFVDVATSDWACRYIKRLKDIGAISGILQDDGSVLFEPDRPLNEAIAFKMVAVLITHDRGVSVPFGYLYDDGRNQLLESYARQVSLGTLYEQVVDENAEDIEFTIQGSSRTTTENGSLYRMASNCTTCTYYWEASSGSFSEEDDNLKTIRFIPGTGQEKAYLYGFISDGLGATSTIRREIQVTDAFQGGGNSVFSAVFNASEQNVILNYQLNDQIDYLLIEYSFDQQRWEKSFEKNITFIRAGNQTQKPENLSAHSRIYFRVSTRIGEQSLQREPIIRVDYEIPDENLIEVPVSPKIFPLGATISEENIEVVFRKVLDSNFKHNADYYQFMYADNYLFNGAKVERIDDPTTGDNLYETIRQPVTNLKDNTTYYFKVRAMRKVDGEDDIEGRWSVAIKTKVEYQDKPEFDTTYQFPEDGERDVSKTPRLCWSATDDDGDDLEFALSWGTESDKLRYSESFNQGDECFNFATQSQRTLLPGQTYYWQVRVREDGKYRDAYGGSYISSPVWSFTTVAEGQDLAITHVEVSSNSLIIPEAEVTLNVTVTNQGNELAKAERLQAFYIKGGQESEFRCCTKLMPQDLPAGESVTFPIKVRFDDEIETGVNGETFDNILAQGNSQIRLAFQHISEQDVNPANNEYILDIAYNDQGAPEITSTFLNLFGKNESKGWYVRQGSDIRIVAAAEDDFNLVSLAVYYQLSADAPWELIYIEENNTDDDISYLHNWRVPENVLATNARIKFVAVDSNGQVAEKLSPEFRIASNNLSGSLEAISNELTIGEIITLRPSTEGDYPIERYWVNLIAADDVELVEYTREALPSAITVQMPQNNNLAISGAHIEVGAVDYWGNEVVINSNRFELIADTQAEGPVTEIVQLREALAQPPEASYWSEGYIPVVHRVDSKGNKHVIIRSNIRYWLMDSDSSTPDELKVMEDELYYQQVSSEGVKGKVRSLPRGFSVVDFRLDSNDKGYLLLEREEQLAVVEIENDIPAPIRFIFNENSPSIFPHIGRDTGLFNHSLVDQGYLLNGYWYHLKNVRSEVKRYPFFSGGLGREETISLSPRLNRYYETDYSIKATHLENTLHFIQAGESTLIWFDTVTGSAGETPLPFNFDRDIDGDDNTNKMSLFTWQNNVYLSMRGTLFRFTGSGWATIAEMYLQYAGEQALLTQDNYADWEDEIRRFEVIPAESKIFVFAEFDGSGSRSRLGLTYPQFQEKDVFELNINTGELLNITVEDQFRNLRNYKGATIGFGDHFLHLGFDDSSSGNSPDVHFWLDKINPATGSVSRSINQLQSASASRDTRPSLASYRLFWDESDDELYAVAWGAIYRLDLNDYENELTYYTSPALYSYKGDVYLSYRFGDGAYDGRFSHMSGDNFRSNLFDPARRIYRNQNLTKGTAAKPFFAQGSGFISGREYETVSGDYFYNHGDIYPLASDDFVVNGEKICTTRGYYDVVGVSSHPDFQFIEYQKSPDRLELYRSDCTLYATVPVTLESGIRDFHFSQANADYVVAAFEDTNLTTNIFRYHLATQQSEVFVLPQTTRAYPHWRNFNANETLQFGLSWGGNNLFYAYGEFGGDIVAPVAELQVSSLQAKPGDIVQLSWSSPEAVAQLSSATITAIDSKGNRTEIFTTTTEFSRSLDYQIPANLQDTSLLFELALEDASGNIGYAQKGLEIEQPISLESFSVDRTAADEGETIYVSWRLKGKRSSEKPRLVLVNQFNSREVAFTTTTEGFHGLNTSNLAGRYQLRLDIRDRSFVLPQTIEIGGTHVNFIYDGFSPVSSVLLANERGTISFTWQTDVQADTGWLARLFLKSLNDDTYREIGDSDSNQFDFAAEDMAGEYQWYVEFIWEGVVFTSQVQQFVVQPLAQVSSIDARVVDPTVFRPSINVTWNAVTGAERYTVFLQTEDGQIQQLTETASTEYVYEGAQYFEVLSFGVASATSGTIADAHYAEPLLVEPILPSAIKFVESSLDNPSEGAEVSVTLTPELAYANIEFSLENLITNETIILDNVTPGTALLPLLEAGGFYVIEARAKYPGNGYVPGVRDSEIFTVSYNYGIVSGTPSLSVATQSDTEIGLTWTPTSHAESYQLTRYKPGVTEGEVLLTTAAHGFNDDSIVLNQAYRYQLVAQNPLSSTTSELTPWVHDQAPVIAAPANLAIVTNDPSGISIEHPEIQALINSVSVSDDISGGLVINHNLPLILPEGEFTAVFTTTDEANNVATASVVIAVVYESLDILRNANLDDSRLTACLLESYADTTLFTDITTIACSDKGITSLAGIETFTEARTVRLDSNVIADISPITGLTGIRELNVAANRLTSIGILRNLQNLTELDVSANNLASINTINEMQNLTSVNASNNQITDIAPLLSSTTLPAALNVVGNGVQCEQLYRLNLLAGTQNLSVQSDYNADTCDADADGLSDATEELNGLDPLNASDASADFDGDGFSNSDEISAGTNFNDPADYPGVNDVTALEDVVLGDSQLQQCLTGLFSNDTPIDQITQVTCEDMAIVSLSGLQELTSIRELNLKNNRIVNIAAIGELTSLSVLDLSGNEVTDYSVLSDLRSLSSLKADNSGLSGLSWLSGLTNLNALSLAGNQISDLTPISGIDSLEELDLSDNHIADINTLMSWTLLPDALAISGNTIDCVTLLELTERAQEQNIQLVSDYSVSCVTNNTAPTVEDISIEADFAQDNVVTIALNGLDSDGDDLTYRVTVQPVRGAVEIAGDNAVYTFNGSDFIGDQFNVVANDGLTDSNAATVFIVPPEINLPPVIEGNPAPQVNVGEIYLFEPLASDPEGQELVFSIQNQPLWSQFNSSTGVLSGTPLNDNAGRFEEIVISVTDGVFSTELPAFTITVTKPNSAPVINGNPATVVAVGEIYQFLPVASDVDGDELVFNIENLPPWAGFNSATGEVSGTPGEENVGVTDGIRMSVSDGEDVVYLPTFSIVVTAETVSDPVAENQAPVIFGTPETSVLVGELYQFSPSATDADGDSLTFSVENLPQWVSFNSSTGEMVGTPDNQHAGNTQNITVSVSDGIELVSLEGFNLQVIAVNNPPTGTPLSLQLSEDTSLAVTPSVFDADGDSLILQILQAPANGSLLDTANGWIFSPQLNYVGADEFTYQVSDGESVSEPVTVSLNILNINDSPVASDDSFTFDKQSNDIYLLDVLANDIDVDVTFAGDELLLQSARANTGSVIIVDNQLQYTASSDYSGDVLIDYIVVDSAGEFDQASVLLSIVDTSGDALPIINIPADITLNATGLFTPVNPGFASAEDSDGNPLPVFIAAGSTLLSPGKHQILWQTEDRFGNTASKAQVITINPLVNLGQEQIVAEGSRVLIPVSLNGAAPEYPMSVAYTILGSASGEGADHNLTDGNVVFTSGTNAYIEFDVFVDGEIESIEDIVVVLDQSVNAGAQSSTRVWITEANIAPEVNLRVVQAGIERTLVSQGDGTVLVSASSRDPNIGDNLSIEWRVSAVSSVSNSLPANTAQDVDEFAFAPELVDAGVYRITAVVTDNGAPVLTDVEHKYIEVVTALTPLATDIDSDGDLIPDSEEGYLDLDGDGIPAYLDSRDECNVVPGVAGAATEYFLEAQNGVCMREGSMAASNEQNGLALPAQDNMAVDPSAQLTGELFDFELYGLPVAGQSSQVVIPQSSPIPVGARYRKYNIDSQTWYDFVVNDNNKVYSASSEQGACPPPGSSDWQEGLVAGNWCVQLLIQDGGPNDADGTANGSIADPGGIAIDLTDNEAPVVVNDAMTIRWNTTMELDVLANDADPEGDSLTLSAVSAQIGEVEITDNNTLLYQPPENFGGEDAIRYYAVDEVGQSSQGEATITILPNRSPVANNDNAQTEAGTTIEIDPIANDQDIDGDALTLMDAQADSGEVTIIDNKVQFTPVSDSPASVAILYVITDGEFTASANITVTITEAETPPTEQPVDSFPEDDSNSGGSMGLWGLLLTLAWMVRRYKIYS